MESGDVAQYYNQTNANREVRITEKQEPNLWLGYHREWIPGSHTLLLAGRFDDTLTVDGPAPNLLYLRTFDPGFGTPSVRLQNPDFETFDRHYESELEAYSAELQQIWQTPAQALVAGGRYQTGSSDSLSDLDRFLGGFVTPQEFTTDLERWAFYVYEHWQVFPQLRLTAGVSYDRLHYPVNIDTSPISGAEKTKDQVSPKAGLQWSPWRDSHLRAAYTRSLGGVFFDNSIRLEPTQVAGFNQAFRSLIPESVVGLVPGTTFQTWGLGLDQSFQKTGTYLVLEGELLESEASRTIGLLVNGDVEAPSPDTASSTSQSLDYQEKSVRVALGQLLGEQLAVGARYRFTRADLETRSREIAPSVTGAGLLNEDVAALLHQVQLYALYNHPSGVFAQFDSIWSQQSNRDYATALPGDDFWQHNVAIGYRGLQRRFEARVALLNFTDQDYRLNPLSLHRELPRGRTFAASLKFHF
jgi:outer membrane receptor protein involved in Fe transport